MDSLIHDDSRAELGRAHHRNRAGSQIPDVDGPWISLSIQFGRSHRQIDDRRRIEEFEELSAKVSSNCAAVGLQMNYLSFLDRVRLAENQSDANKQRLHNCSIDWGRASDSESDSADQPAFRPGAGSSAVAGPGE